MEGLNPGFYAVTWHIFPFSSPKQAFTLNVVMAEVREGQHIMDSHNSITMLDHS